VTEERFDPAIDVAAARQSPWWGVHASRYLLAAPHVRDRRLLDVACGTGYGMTMLRAEARSVVGVDADFASARKARAGANGRTHAVLVADGARLPFGEGAFDAVTSFETLEHLHERDGFLDELRRVLARNGVCVLSTPNANYTEPVAGKPRNPFHVHEYTPEELRAALSARFTQVELHAQILSPRFAISPFWDDQQKLPRTVGAQSKRLMWKVLNRLPAGLRDGASRALWGHQLIPNEHDYELTDDVEMAPVLVAICRAPRWALRETA
jgi:ubiquinone/menaquinone biosynthesis C-methylase UbiE